MRLINRLLLAIALAVGVGAAYNIASADARLASTGQRLVFSPYSGYGVEDHVACMAWNRVSQRPIPADRVRTVLFLNFAGDFARVRVLNAPPSYGVRCHFFLTP